MAAADARFVPKKAAAFRVTFGIFDTTGDLVINASGRDSEISKDQAPFADCTNEAIEIAKGVYYFDLTAAEMTADSVVVVVQTNRFLECLKAMLESRKSAKNVRHLSAQPREHVVDLRRLPRCRGSLRTVNAGVGC